MQQPSASAALDDVGRSVRQPQDGLCPPAVFAVIVNACMGMGFLALPYTSMRLGPWLAAVVTLALGALATLTALWTVTALSLTAALVRGGGDPEMSSQARLMDGKAEPPAEQGGVFCLDGSGVHSFVAMVGLLYGDWSQRAATSALTLSLVVTLWSYAALVASSLSAMVPLPLPGSACDVYTEWSEAGCATRYYTWLGGFALVAVACSMLRLKEQKVFQLAMTGARFLLVTIILADCVRMLVLGEEPPRPGRDGSLHLGLAQVHGGALHRGLAHGPPAPGLGEVDLRRLPRHIAVATVALAANMVLPEAVQDLADKPRTLLPTVGSALACCAGAYCLVGTLVALAFGDLTRPVCTLNWANYTAGEAKAGSLALAVRALVLLVPIVDITAAYPIMALGLTSSIHSSLAGREGAEAEEWPPWYLSLLCSFLPIVGAAFIFDIAETLGWAGVFFLPFVFLLPQMLMLRAEELCVARFGAERVHGSLYWRWHCHRRVLLASLLAGGAFSAVACLVTLGDAL